MLISWNYKVAVYISKFLIQLHKTYNSPKISKLTHISSKFTINTNTVSSLNLISERGHSSKPLSRALR